MWAGGGRVFLKAPEWAHFTIFKASEERLVVDFFPDVILA